MAHLFTSESVSEGHPDKICDQISDAILDTYLRHNPESRVAVEAMVTKDHVILAGEIRIPGESSSPIDRQVRASVVRDVIHDIGYTYSDLKFHSGNVQIIDLIHKQSHNIAKGVDREHGAGDQGMMFGYACREFSDSQDGHDTLMPMPLIYAHHLVQELAEIRKKTSLMPYLRPDSKSQVSIEYDPTGRIPQRVDTIVIATQHDDGVDRQQIKKDVDTHLIRQVIDSRLIDDDTKIIVNSAGDFVLGGPHADAGLTGRKIIVDTYGGRGAHGGGAFSGKDPTKVDRSAAYAARYVAKNIVAADLAEMVEIQISYAIGKPDPVSIFVNSYETVQHGHSDSDLVDIISRTFDLRPDGIIERLNLKQPIYQKTAAYGHFGRKGFPWESLDAVQDLNRSA